MRSHMVREEPANDHRSLIPKSRLALERYVGDRFFFKVVSYFSLAYFLLSDCYSYMQQQPLVDWGHVTTLGDLYNYLTRQEFGGVFLMQTRQLTFCLSNLFSRWAMLKLCLCNLVSFRR